MKYIFGLFIIICPFRLLILMFGLICLVASITYLIKADYSILEWKYDLHIVKKMEQNIGESILGIGIGLICIILFVLMNNWTSFFTFAFQK